MGGGWGGGIGGPRRCACSWEVGALWPGPARVTAPWKWGQWRVHFRWPAPWLAAGAIAGGETGHWQWPASVIPGASRPAPGQAASRRFDPADSRPPATDERLDRRLGRRRLPVASRSSATADSQPLRSRLPPSLPGRSAVADALPRAHDRDVYWRAGGPVGTCPHRRPPRVHARINTCVNVLIHGVNTRIREAQASACCCLARFRRPAPSPSPASARVRRARRSSKASEGAPPMGCRRGRPELKMRRTMKRYGHEKQLNTRSNLPEFKMRRARGMR